MRFFPENNEWQGVLFYVAETNYILEIAENTKVEKFYQKACRLFTRRKLMELQIQDLVTSIRKEGIDAANTEAESIIAEAKKKAAAIISDAKAEAANAKATAEKEIGIMKESASVSAEQAKRDAVLAFKTEVQTAFENILKNDVKTDEDATALMNRIKDALDPARILNNNKSYVLN